MVLAAYKARSRFLYGPRILGYSQAPHSIPLSLGRFHVGHDHSYLSISPIFLSAISFFAQSVSAHIGRILPSKIYVPSVSTASLRWFHSNWERAPKMRVAYPRREHWLREQIALPRIRCRQYPPDAYSGEVGR